LVLLLVPPMIAVAEEPSVPGLIAQLKADKESDRADAVRALGQLGPKGKAAAPALASALKDRSAHVRLLAAFALLQVDQSRGKEIFATLTALLEDKTTAGLPLAMVVRMREVQPASPEVVRELLALAHNDHPLALPLAASALGNLGPQSAPAAGLLQEALKDQLADVRLAAALGLLRIDRKYQPEAFAVLRPMLQDRDLSNRLEAACALLEFDANPPKEAARVLAALLKDKDATNRRQGVQIIARLGSAALGLEAELKALVKDADPRLAADAGEALMRLRPEKARAFFADLLANRDRAEKDDVGKLFELIDGLHKVAADLPADDRLKMLTEQLRKPMKRSNADLVRLDAVIRLGDMGPQARDAVGDLVKATRDASPVVRSLAVYALGQVGPSAGPAVPRLLELSKNDPRDLREAARAALKRIDPEAARQAGLP
jgi:HEAT repeat protein